MNNFKMKSYSALGGILMLSMSVLNTSCQKTVQMEAVDNSKKELELKDPFVEHVAYLKVNEIRITEGAKFKLAITDEEAKEYLPQTYFDIAIVFESAKIIPANSPKLRGEKRAGADKYVLAYKEWEWMKEVSPSAKALDRKDLYSSDGKQIDDPAPKNRDPGRYSLTMNQELQNDIKELKKSGMKILMDIMPDHEDAGWQSFKNQEEAKNFALQINDAINLYGWDGIDIDEEYAKYTQGQSQGSTTRVLYELKKIWAAEDYKHPGKKLLLGKALFADGGAFTENVSIDGKNIRLADVLDAGWDMTYFSSAYSSRLSAYEGYGMKKSQLGLGVDIPTVNTVANGVATAKFIKNNKYKYMMYYDVRGSRLNEYKEVAKVFSERELKYLND